MPLSSHSYTRLVPYHIRFPSQAQRLDQDEEFCDVKIDDRWERFRFHDYDRIYRQPGLYESLFYRKLKCCSPSRVVGLLDEVMSDYPQDPADLCALDVGAGNGMVGQELWGIGARRVVGVDIIPEAKDAAMRDRPGVYSDYLVADLCDLPAEDAQRLEAQRFNCLTTVAALGFGDIPARAFATAYNLVSRHGWIAFNIKEDFLDDADDSGFSAMIRRMNRENIMQIQAYRRYCHRLSIDGERLHYVAMIAIKQRNIPEGFMPD